MADRTERVILTAQISNYISGMEKARIATDATATAAQKLANKKEAFNTLGIGLIAFGGAVSAGLLLAVSKMAEFDSKMAQVQTLSHSTGAEMDQLSNSALHLGQSIGFSASQVADAEIELVKAGVSVKDQLGGGLVGTLNLAAAGQLDVADATQIAASAMTQFALKGKDVPHIADLLAAGADKALGSVQDLGNGLKFVGPVAHSMGVSLDQTVGTLALFAQNGILGEQAGTGLRGVLLSLTSPSKQASDVMKEYGINLYDAQGHFVGLSGTAQQLKKGLGGLDEATRNQALGQIFGNQQITEATILMNGGAKEVNKWTKAVNDQGFAAEQAAGKMDSLKGDLSKLQAALDTGLIESASGANGILRGTVQNLTGLTTVVSNLPGPVLQVGFGIGALVAGVTLLGGTALVAVPKIAAFKLAMKDLDLSAGSLAGKVGKGGAILLGLTALAAGFGNLGATSELSADRLAQVDRAADSLSKKDLSKLFKDAGTAIVDGTAKSDKFKESLNAIATGNFWENEAGPAKFVDGVSLGLTHLSDVYKTNQAQFQELGKKIADVSQTDLGAAQDGFKKMVTAAGGGKEAIRQLLTVMPDYKAQLIAIAGDQGKTLTTTELYNLAIGKGSVAHGIAAKAAEEDAAQVKAMGGSASAAANDVSDLADKIKGFGSLTLDARSAERDFKAAIEDASQAFKDNGNTLDDNTDKGRANEASLDAIAQSAISAAAAIYQQTGSQDQATQSIAAGRQALIDALGQYGITGQAAQDYADKLGLIPGQVTTTISADVGPALTGLKLLEKQFNTTNAAAAAMASRYAGYAAAHPQANGSVLRFFANGGENHVAQVAPAGAMRLWAEPETGGEAYIPLAAAKRARSTAILSSVAQGFGYSLAKYAGGAYVAPTYVPAQTSQPGMSGPAVAFPSQVTLVDANGSILGHMDVRIQQHDSRSAMTVANGKKQVR